MQQKEFFDRTGIIVTADEYQEIESMYMAAGEMDKDVFCSEYKKHGKSLLAKVLHQTTKILKGQIEERRNIISDLHDQKNEMANFLIEQAHKWSASDLREKAIEILGIQEYLKRMIENGYSLWDADYKALIGILSNNNKD